MKNSSQNRKMIRTYVGSFIFRDKKCFSIDKTGYLLPINNGDFPALDGKFIRVNLEKGNSRQQKQRIIFRCAYKMMRNFNCSLN